MKHLLESYQKQRFDWAFKAKEEFLSNFRIFEVENRAISNDRLVISVYGPTQVGKSTLILTLLGLKYEYLNAISKALRGKRNVGQSSTVTVTIYQISTTDFFQVKMPNEEVQIVKTTEELENILFQLRQDVEENIVRSVDPIVIAIPKYMFQVQDRKLEIIDLPGIESAEEKETEHVEKCIKYWIPNSHICLIVNSANDLTFLRDIELPQLKHWYEYESNYFLILTRSLTPISVKNAVKNKEIQTGYDIVEYYKTYISDILKHKKGTIFPLDIGESFQNLNKNEQHIVIEVFNLLKERLSQIDVKQISFNYLSSYYKDVLERGRNELEFLEKEIQEKEISINKLKNDKEMSKKYNYKAFEKLAEQRLFLHNELSDITKVVDLNFKFYENQIEMTVKESPVTKEARGIDRLFSELIYEIESDINKEVTLLNEKLNRIKEALNFNDFECIPLISLDFNFRDPSYFNHYLIEKNYLKQKDETKVLLQSKLEKQFYFIEQAISVNVEQLNFQKNILNDKILELKNRCKLEYENYNQRIEEELKNKKAIKKVFNEVCHMWESDRRHALQYKEYFIKNFIKRKNELLEMATSRNYEQQYLAFLFLQVLSDDAEKIISSMNIEDKDNKYEFYKTKSR